MTDIKDKFFDHCLSKYKSHWHRYGKSDCDQPQRFLNREGTSLFDYEWIHELGDHKIAEFESYIESGELANYIYQHMEDYASDLQYHKNPEKYLGYPY